MKTGASKTALLMSAYRGRLSAAPDRLCNDPWAAALAGEEGHALTVAWDKSYPHMELWTAVRTAFIDACVMRATRASTASPLFIGQVVLLGAGLDTRAARLAQSGVRFFEVDHPDTQADKLERIATLRDYPREAATYVTCDFEKERFLERLTTAGFDAASPALFIWEGVTPYLSEVAVRATLRSIAEGSDGRSVVVFDHVRKKIVAGDVRDPVDLEPRAIVEGMGEPLRFGVDDVLPLLYEEGFRRVRVTSFDEACLDLTGTYQRERKFRFQGLVVASRAATQLPV